MRALVVVCDGLSDVATADGWGRRWREREVSVVGIKSGRLRTSDISVRLSC
jgi:hypothetical protein